jgi:hypothetical protein
VSRGNVACRGRQATEHRIWLATAGLDVTSYYPDWESHQDSFLNFTSEPLHGEKSIVRLPIILQVTMLTDQDR